MPATYPVYEMFHTFQGEGVHLGKPAAFVRLYGCPVHCPWCDSAGTWHKNYMPNPVEKLTVHEICHYIAGLNTDMVVITGGEPAAHDLSHLLDGLIELDVAIHIETSGGFDLGKKSDRIDWVTLSPKKWKLPLRENVMRANEFKIIVECPEDIPFYLKELLSSGYGFYDQAPVWLHPEWSKREDRDVLRAITKAVKEQSEGAHLRAGWQIHKLYNVDAADKRSRPLVPLGGDVTKGF